MVKKRSFWGIQNINSEKKEYVFENNAKLLLSN